MNKEDITYLFNERAAILEHEGGNSPSKSASLAFIAMAESLLQERFAAQNSIKNYEEFKKQEHEMVWRTLYSWDIKPS